MEQIPNYTVLLNQLKEAGYTVLITPKYSEKPSKWLPLKTDYETLKKEKENLDSDINIHLIDSFFDDGKYKYEITGEIVIPKDIPN